MRRLKVLISAGEASGDLYASALAAELRRRDGRYEFFGSPGPRMMAVGVRAVMDQSQLSVVGLAEVIRHLPAIYGEFQKLIRAAAVERPAVAVLTDSSGFHLRVARALKALGIPVVYLVAPQAWAWRRGRVYQLQRNVERLLCIFPFEEKFFRSYGIRAYYVGHPLSRLISASTSRDAFRAAHGLDPQRPLVALLPGSRVGEIRRHLPLLRAAMTRIDAQFLLGTPPRFDTSALGAALADRPVTIASGQTWDLLAHCDVALAASGTVTVEGAILGAPMVSFYRVSPLTYLARPLIRAPFLSMVNLIAGRAIIPELIQHEATPERLAAETNQLLASHHARAEMRRQLEEEVAARLRTVADPIATVADHVEEVLRERGHAH